MGKGTLLRNFRCKGTETGQPPWGVGCGGGPDPLAIPGPGWGGPGPGGGEAVCLVGGLF